MKGLNIAVHQSIAENVIGTHVWGERMSAVKDFECAICQCLTFEGDGCAISLASASIMTELIKGKSFDEISIFGILFLISKDIY